VSTTAVSGGTTVERWLSGHLLLQATLLGGVGYAAVQTINGTNDRDYHYGMTPQAVETLRMVAANRVSFDVSARQYFVTGVAGFDTPGTFRPSSSLFILSIGFSSTVDITAFFGAPGVRPIVGDWDGDGVTTIGVFNPGTGTMALNNTNTSGNGVGDIVFSFGLNGDSPLAGDWDGKAEVPVN